MALLHLQTEDGVGSLSPPASSATWFVSSIILLPWQFTHAQVLDGIGYSFGIFVKPLEAHFEGAGKGKISLVRIFFSIFHITTFHLLTQVGSILAGFIMLVGPISSAMVNKFGPRLTCIGNENHCGNKDWFFSSQLELVFLLQLFLCRLSLRTSTCWWWALHALLFLINPPFKDLLWDRGWPRSWTHVCSCRHCCWLLVREKAISCHRWDL